MMCYLCDKELDDIEEHIIEIAGDWGFLYVCADCSEGIVIKEVNKIINEKVKK